MQISKFNHNASMVRGDSESIKVKLLTGYNYVNGDTLTLTVRKTVTSEIAFSVTTDEILQDNDGVYCGILSIQHDDTAELAFGKYVYDIQLTMNGAIKTIIPCAVFEIKEEVTY